MAELVRSLARLRSEFNWLAPARDTESDGWIGDAAHQAEKSDHNPDGRGFVHAIDVDDDLRTAGVTMDLVVQFLLKRCRAGVEKRFTYVIYRRRIWSASDGWVERVYTGPSAHTEHAHFSASHVTAREADQSTFHLEELKPVTAPTPAQNADAVAGKDIDPSAGTYSLGGALWTMLARTSALNTLPGQVADLRDDLDGRVKDVDDELDGLAAALVLISAKIDALLAGQQPSQ